MTPPPNAISSRRPEGDIDESRYRLIPPGTYDLKFTGHETALMFNRAPKLILWFSVIDFGDQFGTAVPRFYNVKCLLGKPGRGGRFRAKARGDLILDYYALFPPPKRLDRVSFDPWRTSIIRGVVDTVSVTSNQRSLPEALRYSVVRTFAGIKKL